MLSYKEQWCEFYDMAKERGATNGEAEDFADNELIEWYASKADEAKEWRKYERSGL